MTPPASRLLTLADVEQAARVISQAFVDDPLCAFMFPFRPTRTRTLRLFFRAYGDVMIKNQCGYGIGDPLQGVAFWLAPDRPNVSISLKSLGRFIPVLFSMYPVGYLRAKAVLRAIDALHEKHASEPHYYLDNLGVLASARGQGLSSRLIRPILAQADSQKVIAYTDTVTPANVPLYEHFGFQCVEQVAVPGTGITVFALRRPAQ